MQRKVVIDPRQALKGQIVTDCGLQNELLDLRQLSTRNFIGMPMGNWKDKVTIAEKDDGTHLVLIDQKYDPKFSILLWPNWLSRSATSHLIQQVDSSLPNTTTCVSMTAVTVYCATMSLTLLVPTWLGILWPRATIPVCTMSVVKDAYSRVLTNVFSNKKSNLPRKLYKYEAETKSISRKGSQMALTCMKYLPCGVIYLLYLVHISHNLFPSCCQRCTTQIVPTMCYHTQNNYFLFIHWVFQLYLLPYYTIHQGLSIHQIPFP